MKDNDGKNWEQLYQEALFELDVSKLPERIEVAHSAVEAQLRNAVQVSENASQRHALLDALRNLQALRRGRS